MSLRRCLIVALAVAVSAACGAAEPRGRSSSFMAHDVTDWYVWQEPGNDAVYLRRHLNRVYPNATTCVAPLIIRISGRSLELSGENYWHSIRRFRSTATLWKSLAADFAVDRELIDHALKHGQAATRPGWAAVFDRDCRHRGT